MTRTGARRHLLTVVLAAAGFLWSAARAQVAAEPPWPQSAEAAAAERAALRSTERAEIKAQRTRVHAEHAAREAECASRFAVNACLDDVRQSRRAALGGLRARDLALDELERRERAATRRAAVQARLRAPEPLADAAPPPPTSGAASLRNPVTVQPMLDALAATHGAAAPAAPAATAATVTRHAAAASEAARRAAAAHQRQQRLRSDAQRIEQRLARHDQQPAPPGRRGPLPLPPAASQPAGRAAR